jgi:hypothetical protein
LVLQLKLVLVVVLLLLLLLMSLPLLPLLLRPVLPLLLLLLLLLLVLLLLMFLLLGQPKLQPVSQHIPVSTSGLVHKRMLLFRQSMKASGYVTDGKQPVSLLYSGLRTDVQ